MATILSINAIFSVSKVDAFSLFLPFFQQCLDNSVMTQHDLILLYFPTLQWCKTRSVIQSFLLQAAVILSMACHWTGRNPLTVKACRNYQPKTRDRLRRVKKKRQKPSIRDTEGAEKYKILFRSTVTRKSGGKSTPVCRFVLNLKSQLTVHTVCRTLNCLFNSCA
jgi:hypothetical protein